PGASIPQATLSIPPVPKYKQSPPMEIAKLSAAKIRNLDPVDGGMGAMLTGLRDISTCYMNCILQCLCNTPAMAEYFTKNYYQEDINRTKILGYEGEFTMGKVCNVFAGNEPQDAREFMLFLLDADLAWSRHKLQNDSIIVALFHGQLKITVQCLTCQHKTRTFETFNCHDLSLASSKECSLHDCLKLFSREQKLDNHDVVFCSHCKAWRDSMRKVEIWKVPPILVVYLRRLTFKGRRIQKLQTNIDFPMENLDLTQYVIGPKQRLKKYNLFAVSNHYGGLNGGYYTAFCKNAIKQQWYKFEDKDVSDISTSSVKSSAALFCHSWGHYVTAESMRRARKFKPLGCCHRVTLEVPIQEGSRSLLYLH
uniref:ubiquitinyl hydrolase 1 n=1 Tax=Hucho hucho TaxID=62062 RepID=A0A4W5JLL7_9TELE